MGCAVLSIGKALPARSAVSMRGRGSRARRRRILRQRARFIQGQPAQPLAAARACRLGQGDAANPASGEGSPPARRRGCRAAPAPTKRWVAPPSKAQDRSWRSSLGAGTDDVVPNVAPRAPSRRAVTRACVAGLGRSAVNAATTAVVHVRLQVSTDTRAVGVPGRAQASALAASHPPAT